MGVRLPYVAYIALVPLAVVLALLLILRIILRRSVPCKVEDRLDGKVVVITGGNCGIGHATSVELARRGAKVILACRDRTRRDSAPFAVRSRSGNVNVKFMYLDLSSMDSIIEFCHQFVESESRLDVLINNAAVLCPHELTSDGVDFVMGVNYIGHFLLTHLLLEKLKETASGSSQRPRVINVICDGFKSAKLDPEKDTLLPGDDDSYSMYQAYNASKLALLLMTREMADRFRKFRITVLAANPGSSADTKLLRHLGGHAGDMKRLLSRLTFLPPDDAAQTIVYCSVAENLDNQSGKSFKGCQVDEQAALFKTYEELYRGQLWAKTEELIRGKGFDLILKDDEE